MNLLHVAALRWTELIKSSLIEKRKRKAAELSDWNDITFPECFSACLWQKKVWVSASTGQFIKISKTCPPGMFAELEKTQSEVPRESDGCKVFLSASWGYVCRGFLTKTTNWGCLHIHTGIPGIKLIFLILFSLLFLWENVFGRNDAMLARFCFP